MSACVVSWGTFLSATLLSVNFQSRIFHPLSCCPSFSSPAFSSPALLSVIFQSCIFHPCNSVHHIPVLHFPALHFCPSFSSPAIFTLLKFICNFPVLQIQRPHAVCFMTSIHCVRGAYIQWMHDIKQSVGKNHLQSKNTTEDGNR